MNKLIKVKDFAKNYLMINFVSRYSRRKLSLIKKVESLNSIYYNCGA